MADSNSNKARKLQAANNVKTTEKAKAVKKIETAEKKSASKPVRYPKYEKDLEKGKIHICQIPFKYRDAWAYARAMEYIKTRKEIEKKIEKEVVRIQLLNDITESKRVEDAKREADLMAAYEAYFAYGDFDYSSSILAQKQRDWRRKKGVSAPED